MDSKIDYRDFYNDVVAWIAHVNQAAMYYKGMHTSEFWLWIADSSSAICRKYNDNRLVIKQMIMLVEWLEEVSEQRKQQNKGAKAV